MKKLHQLIKGQHIIIDNHHPGTPFRWDRKEGESIDDIHLDKTKDEYINGKKVSIRISLNNDMNVSVPKKRERDDEDWMKCYNDMLKEVREVLKGNEEKRNQLVIDIQKSIVDIGPHKEHRAIKKALGRIARYFDLEEGMFIDYYEFLRGSANIYTKRGVKYYVGFGNDYRFYLGNGDQSDFENHLL